MQERSATGIKSPHVSWAGRLAGDNTLSRITWFNTFRARSDRVIAIGRIILVLGGLYIVWLDSASPPRSPWVISTLLVAYLGYAILVAVLVWRTEVSRVRGTLLRHAVDLCAFAVIMFSSDGTSSPFFMFLPFALLAGTLHWGWRGAFWTALACLLILLPLAATGGIIRPDIDTAATRDASRIVFLFVSAILLVWLGAHQDAVRTELLRLVERTPAVPQDREWPAGASLDYAAHVMRVPRALLVWSDGEEPWSYVASWVNGTTTVARLPPDRYSPLTSRAVENASLLMTASTPRTTLVHRGEGRFRELPPGSPAIHPGLVEDFAIGSVVSASFRVDELEARLFLLDPPELILDQAAIAEIIADRLRALFEQAILVRKLSDAAATEERVKIGRDLHDGVLQALTGTGLQLRLLETQAPTAQTSEICARLAAIQSMLAEEQKDLRAFIQALEPGTPSAAPEQSQLAVQFAVLSRRLQRQWSVDFRFCVEPRDIVLPTSLIYELVHLASEATANAARHGRAKSVTATVRLETGTVILTVEDDGKGFGFDRRMAHTKLQRLNLGPRSLRERAAALGGEVTIDAASPWTRVVIALPLEGCPS